MIARRGRRGPDVPPERMLLGRLIWIYTVAAVVVMVAMLIGSHLTGGAR